MASSDLITTEQWKPIPGYEGFYSVSDQGRIRRDAGGKGSKCGQILRTPSNGTGYLKAILCVNTKHKQYLVHRLVLLAFVGPCPEGQQGNHKNGTKTDNRLDNLEWVTPRDNQLHKHAVLGYPHQRPEPRFGERHPHSKLTDDKVREIRRLAAEGTLLQREIAELFGVKQNVVSRIVRRVAWPHVV